MAGETEPMRDRDRLRNAFEAMRKKGWWCRGNQSDGVAAVPVDVIRRCGSFVLWHENETDIAFDDLGDLMAPLHLHHLVKDTAEIVTVLQAHGLHVKVQGAGDDQAVVVEPDRVQGHA